MKTPKKPIRWRLNQAAAEFGIDDATLSRRLRAAGIAAGADDCFSTKQIMAGVVGDLGGERIKLLAAQREREELALARERCDVLPTALIKPFIVNLLFSVRRCIETSPLPNETKDHIYAELRSLKPEEVIAAAMAEAKKAAA